MLFFNRIGCGLFGRSTLWLGSGNRASTPVLWRSVAPAHASFSKDLGSLQLEILDNFLPFKDFENIECSASTYVLWQLICGMPPSLKGISFCANVCIYSVQKVWNDISSFKFFIEFCRQLFHLWSEKDMSYFLLALQSFWFSSIIFTSFELFCCPTMNNLFTSESSMKRATMQRSMFAEGAICVKIRTAEYTSRLGPYSSLVLLSMSLIFRIMNKDYS